MVLLFFLLALTARAQLEGEDSVLGEETVKTVEDACEIVSLFLIITENGTNVDFSKGLNVTREIAARIEGGGEV